MGNEPRPGAFYSSGRDGCQSARPLATSRLLRASPVLGGLPVRYNLATSDHISSPMAVHPVRPLLRQCPRCLSLFSICLLRVERRAKAGDDRVYRCGKCNQETEFLVKMPDDIVSPMQYPLRPQLMLRAVGPRMLTGGDRRAPHRLPVAKRRHPCRYGNEQRKVGLTHIVGTRSDRH
jgi:hypothetical protein